MYETSEPNWKWDDTGWNYNGNHVKSFPPSFTRKITKTVVNEDLIKSKKTITIDDRYQVKDQKFEIPHGRLDRHGDRLRLARGYPNLSPFGLVGATSKILKV